MTIRPWPAPRSSGLMLLGAGAGTELVLRAEGADAEAGVAALADLIERGFDE